MKIMSWNINGFESAIHKGQLEPLLELAPDIICLQEIKCSSENLLKQFAENYHFDCIYSLAQKKGYSGVAVFTKKQCELYSKSSGNARMDADGRYLRLDFGDFILYNIYMLHGNRDKWDYQPKMEACKHLIKIWNQDLEDNRDVIVATDFNIAHDDIDVCLFKSNRRNIMFTEKERMVIDAVPLNDAFRVKYKEKVSYSWWTYAYHARERDIGWRIDYFFVSDGMMHRIKDVEYMKDIAGSDHCPLLMNVVL